MERQLCRGRAHASDGRRLRSAWFSQSFVAPSSWGCSVAVGVQLDFKGSTLARYDEAMERLGLLPGGPSAAQQLFHWATKTDDGVRIVDVWESREAFEEFLNAKILVVAQEVGVTDPPEIQFFEVHNYLAGGRWRG
jgi:hypothetical protein